MLSGVLLKISDGVVDFKSDLGGRVLRPLSEITQITTDTDMEIQTESGSRTGRLLWCNDQQRFQPQQSSESSPIALQKIISAVPGQPSLSDNASPTGKVSSEETLLPWQTGLEFGTLWHSNRGGYARPFTRLQLSRETERYAFRSAAFSEFGEGDDIARFWDIHADWRVKSPGHVTPRFALETRRDLAQALDLGARVSLSLGRAFDLADTLQTDAEIGLSFSSEYSDLQAFRETYEEGPLGFTRLMPEKYRHYDRQHLDLRLRFQFERELFARGVFMEDITLYPSLTDFGKIQARARSALSFPITEDLKFNLDVDTRFDSQPKFKEVERWQTTLGASLQWDF